MSLMMSADGLLLDARNAFQNGNYHEVQRLCQRILDEQLECADAEYILGIVALRMDQYDDAISRIQKAIEVATVPNFAFYYALGLAYVGKVNSEESLIERQNPIQIAARLADGHVKLGAAFGAQDHLREAIASYHQALELKSDSAEAYQGLAQAYQMLGMRSTAILHYLEALRLIPNFSNCRYSFATCLSGMCYIPEVLFTDAFCEELERCLTDANIDHQALASIALILLRQNAGVSLALTLVREETEASLVEEYWNGTFLPLFTNNLLHIVLQNTVVMDLEFERLLSTLRRVLLRAHVNCNGLTTVPPEATQKFLCSLAIQCCNNEYVWMICVEEEEYIQKLQTDLEACLESSIAISDALILKLLLIGMYKPLWNLKGANKILENESPVLGGLFTRYFLENPRKELHIRRHLSKITRIRRKVSRAVMTQYEEHPYPRWLSLNISAPLTVRQNLRILFPHFHAPDYLSESPIKILIAGCGTGKHAISVATRFTSVDVLAVDLSARSLSYAIRMAEERSVNNIRFAQGDILELIHLEEHFSIIECVGVLHHLDDLIAGWESLLHLLRPSGLMKIGLYSQKARRNILAVRKLVDARELNVTPQELRKIRERLVYQKDDEPICNLTGLSDFYSLSAFRDLMFPVHEQCLAICQLKQILDRLQLKFIGFEFNNPAIKECYRECFPQDPTMTDLSLWEDFEEHNPNTFLNMYQFWCQKHESAP